jgi:hypothetical protein
MSRFDLGATVVTRGVADLLDESTSFAKDLQKALYRYIDCDWGDMTQEDKEANDHAVTFGDDRIFAAYELPETRVWIITEWDRSVTTILLPEEY